MTDAMATVHRSFRSAPRRHSLVPMWFWNDELTEDNLLRQLRMFREAGIHEVMPFPLFGMTTPYLSDEFFHFARFTVRQAARLRMRVWFYDEYNWPGGCGGAGQLFAADPATRMSACRFYRHTIDARAPRDVRIELPPGRLIWAVARQAGSKRRIDLTHHAGDLAITWRAPRGDWDIRMAVVHVIERRLDAVTGARWSNHVGGYLDVMNRRAVEQYLHTVYEPYHRHLGSYFGSTIAGFYNDEAGIWYDLVAKPGGGFLNRYASVHFPASQAFHDDPAAHGFHSSIPWTRDLLHLFRERYGYDLMDRFESLMPGPTTDRAVAYDFFGLLSDSFARNYIGQIAEWCGKRGVQFTGHTGEGAGGDYADQIGRMHIPGMDMLGSREALFGAERLLARQVGSITRATGADCASCEVFGVAPWHYPLGGKFQKLSVLAINGVNLFVPIDAAYSFRSVRKHTANPPGFFQSPLWRYQRELSDRAARLSMITSIGKSGVRVAAMYPSGQSVSDVIGREHELHAVENRLKAMMTTCEQAQIDMDLLHESSLPAAHIANGEIRYPGATYRTILFAGLDVIHEDTLAVIARFVRQGGTLFIWSHLPRLTPRGESLASAWNRLFGMNCVKQITATTRLRLGRGRVILQPDAGRAIRSASPTVYGSLPDVFDPDRPLVVMGNTYPQWIAVDLGRRRKITSLAWQAEAVKRTIPYHYQVQVSDDGVNWRDAARRDGVAGRRHEVALSNVNTRHVRLHVTDGGGRFFGIEGMDLHCLDDAGARYRWAPEGGGKAWLAELLPDEVTSPRWMEDNRPASTLIHTTRTLDAAHRVVCMINASDREVVLTSDAKPGVTVEHWDLADGAVTTASVSGRIETTFGPWQTRVFMLRRGRRRSAPAANLVERRSIVREVPGPWKFTAHDNALPLAATTLTMADPAREARRMASVQGAIPEPLRFVPSLNFRSEFDVRHIPADIRLMFDEHVVGAIKINGKPATAARREPLLDSFMLSVSTAKLLRRGRNIIEGTFAPEMYERTANGSWYAYPNIQPTLDAYLSGSFAVEDNRLQRPPERLQAGDWRPQGYTYLPGGGEYTIPLGVIESDARWIEVDAGGDLVEARLNGRLLGVRIADPMLFELPQTRGGRNMLHVRVVTQLAPLFSALRQPTFSAQAAARPFGLRRVALMRAVSS